MLPCDLCLCSEVQYVVLQNVATMSIKRRVSESHDSVKDMRHVESLKGNFTIYLHNMMKYVCVFVF